MRAKQTQGLGLLLPQLFTDEFRLSWVFFFFVETHKICCGWGTEARENALFSISCFFSIPRLLFCPSPLRVHCVVAVSII